MALAQEVSEESLGSAEVDRQEADGGDGGNDQEAAIEEAINSSDGEAKETRDHLGVHEPQIQGEGAAVEPSAVLQAETSMSSTSNDPAPSAAANGEADENRWHSKPLAQEREEETAGLRETSLQEYGISIELSGEAGAVTEKGMREAEISMMKVDTMDLEVAPQVRKSPKKRQVSLNRDYKLLRMRAVMCEGIPRLFNPKIVRPPTPPNIVTIQRGRPLNAYLSSAKLKSYPRVLEPIPALKGDEITRQYNKVRASQRKDLGYLGSTMSRGLAPIAKNLGYRPSTAKRGPGGDLLQALSVEETSEQRAGSAVQAEASLAPSAGRKGFGPHELSLVLAADCGSSEQDWWLSPALLLSIDPQLLLHMPQHFMYYGQWERAVSMLCSLHFLAEKLRCWGVQSVLQDLADACEGLAEELSKFKDLMSWQEIYSTWSAQMNDYRSFVQHNLSAITADPAAIFSLALQQDHGTCSADAEQATERLGLCAAQLLEAPSDTADEITTFSRLMAHVRVCRRHGVDRALEEAAAEQLERAEQSVAERLGRWRGEAGAGAAEAVASQLLLEGFQGAVLAARQRFAPKGEPSWYTAALPYRRLADDFAHLVSFLSLASEAPSPPAEHPPPISPAQSPPPQAGPAGGEAPPCSDAEGELAAEEAGGGGLLAGESGDGGRMPADDPPPRSEQAAEAERGGEEAAAGGGPEVGGGGAEGGGEAATEGGGEAAAEAGGEAAAEARAEPEEAHARAGRAGEGGAGGEGRASGGVGNGGRVGVYVSSMEGMREERELLLRVVLPALRKASWAGGAEVSWVDGREESWGLRERNVVAAAAAAMESCSCALFLLAEPRLLSNTNTASQQRARQPELDAGKKAVKRLRQVLAALFESVFDAWAFFDLNGDWTLTTPEFVLMCGHLSIEEADARQVGRVLDKDGYGVIDPWEFVQPVAWHTLPDHGSAAGISLELYHAQRRRPAIVQELKLALRKRSVAVPHIALFDAAPSPKRLRPERSGSSQGSAPRPALQSRKPALQLPQILPQDPALPQAVLQQAAAILGAAWSPEEEARALTLQHAEIIHALRPPPPASPDPAQPPPSRLSQESAADGEVREGAAEGGRSSSEGASEGERGAEGESESESESAGGVGGAVMVLARLRGEGSGEHALDCLPPAVAARARSSGHVRTYTAGEDRRQLGAFALHAYRLLEHHVLASASAPPLHRDPPAAKAPAASPRASSEAPAGTPPPAQQGDGHEERRGREAAEETQNRERELEASGGEEREDGAGSRSQGADAREAGGGGAEAGLLEAEEAAQAALVGSLQAEYATVLELAERAHTLWQEGEEVEAQLEEQDRRSSWAQHLRQLSAWALSPAPPPTTLAQRLDLALVPGKEGGGLSTFFAALLQHLQPAPAPEQGGDGAQAGGAEAEGQGGGREGARVVRFLERGAAGMTAPRFLLPQLLGPEGAQRAVARGSGGTLHEVLAQAAEELEEEVVLLLDGLPPDDVMALVQGWHRVASSQQQQQQQQPSEAGAKDQGRQGRVRVLVSLAVEEGRDMAGTGLMEAVQRLASDGGSVRLTRLLPDLAEGQRLAVLWRRLGPLGPQLSLQRALALVRGPEGGVEGYLSAAARYLREAAGRVEVNEAALAVERTLPALYDMCITPLLERRHGEAAVKAAVEALLQAPQGLPAGLLRGLLTDQRGALLATSAFLPLLGSLHALFSKHGAPPGWGLGQAGAGWGGVTVRLQGRRVQQMLALRYKMRHHLRTPKSLQPAFTPAPRPSPRPPPPPSSSQRAPTQRRGGAGSARQRGGLSRSGAAGDGGGGQAEASADWEAIRSAMQGLVLSRLAEELEAEAEAQRGYVGAVAELREALETRAFVRHDTPPPEPAQASPASESPELSSAGALLSAGSERQGARSSDEGSASSLLLLSPPQASVTSPLGRTREAYSPPNLRHQPSMRQRWQAHPQLASSFVERAEPPTLLDLQHKALREHAVGEEEELVSGVTRGANLDQGHMMEALQASALFPELQAQLDQLQADPEEAARCREELEQLRERQQELQRLFDKAAMDVLWLVKAVCHFDVAAQLDDVQPGVYLAMWHLKLDPTMDFPDIVCTLHVAPEHSAGPLVSHVISVADQDGCKTGQWSCFVTCRQFYVARPCAVTSRLCCQGRWVSGLVIDAFSLIPLAQADRAALLDSLPALPSSPRRPTPRRVSSDGASEWLLLEDAEVPSSPHPSDPEAHPERALDDSEKADGGDARSEAAGDGQTAEEEAGGEGDAAQASAST